MKKILAGVLNEMLAGKEFNADATGQWTKEISDAVKVKLKGPFSASSAARAVQRYYRNARGGCEGRGACCVSLSAWL